MKFTKHQKEIIRHIYSGDIYDILSYLEYFNLGRLIQFDKSNIYEQFVSDDIPKKYYCYKDLQHSYANVLPEIDYQAKVQNGDISPDNYNSYTLELNYNSGIKSETWNNRSYTLDFYNGVYIANSYNDILNFLTLWQYLANEMLILEVPQEPSKETLGLFYQKTPRKVVKNNLLSDRIKNIDFDHFTYDDKYYLGDNNYVLSHEHCTMAGAYINKKIYPSAKLGIFIQDNFKTYEEKTQNRALFVAWLAILVSILLTFIPNLSQEETSNLDSVIQNLESITNSPIEDDTSYEVSNKLDIISEKLDVLIELLRSE